MFWPEQDEEVNQFSAYNKTLHIWTLAVCTYIVLIYKVDCNWSVCIPTYRCRRHFHQNSLPNIILLSQVQKNLESTAQSTPRYKFTYATFHDPWAMNHDDHGGKIWGSRWFQFIHSILLFNCSRIIMTRSWLLFDLPEAKVEAASLYKFHISPQFFFCNSSQHSLAHSETELMPS